MRLDFFDVPELVERGGEVVRRLQVLSELRDPGHHRVDNDLGRHELPQGELLLDDEESAEAEHGCAGERVERQHADRLPQDDAEVFTPRSDVRAEAFVQGVEREAFCRTCTEGRVVSPELLDPGDDGILRLGLLDRGRHTARAEPEDHHEQAHDQERVEGEQKRVVEREQREADHELERDRQPIEQESSRCFLDGEDVEETIELLRWVLAAESIGPRTSRAPADAERGVHEEPLLERLDEPHLNDAHRGRERERREEDHRHDDDRLKESAHRDRANERLRSDRDRERREPDEHPVNHDGPDLGALNGHEGPQALPRGRVGVAVAMAVVGHGARLARLERKESGFVAGVREPESLGSQVDFKEARLPFHSHDSRSFPLDALEREERVLPDERKKRRISRRARDCLGDGERDHGYA